MSARHSALEQVCMLVENFRRNESDYCRQGSQYTETELRRDFIDPFFKALGWDVENSAALPQHLREVVHEAKVTLSSRSHQKKPDYAFRLAGTRKFFVETKKPSVAVERDPKSTFQLRRYGWSAKLPVSVLSNFRHLIIYDCRHRPDENDDFRTCRIKSYSYLDYERHFDEIHELLSRESVYTGMFDSRFAVPVLKGTILFDEYFLAQIERWRLSLATDILRKNPHLAEDELNYLAESFINRIVFLRICEDREIEKYETLLETTKAATRKKLLEIFEKADRRYNSGIFDFRKDTISLSVRVSDNALIAIISELYYPKSPYIFSVVESNIIGDIYELFLTKRITITKKRKVRIVRKPETPHDLGIVTTPSVIVHELVRRTIKPLCEGKDPDQISKLRFLDMACGSGTFLLEAYTYLLDYHLNWYIQHQASDKIYRGEGDYWYLTLNEKKRILLNNIFGVDVDANAAEVAKFSLLVRLLQDESEPNVSSAEARGGALPSLDENIKCGNSLVDNSFFLFKRASDLSEKQLRQLRVFDWDEAFQLVARSGFDAIVGNPPYTRIQTMQKLFPLELDYYQSGCYKSSTTHNFDKYYLFIERALGLLRSDGLVGYIVPHKFMKIKAGEPIRKLIADGGHMRELVHFGAQQVFEKARRTTYTCLLVLGKSRSPKFQLEQVKNISQWRYDPAGRATITVDASGIDSSPWLFTIEPLRFLVDRLRALPERLSDVTDIFVGLQTSMDKVYVVKPQSSTRTQVKFTDVEGRRRTIEKKATLPAIYDLETSPFMTLAPNSRIIFPYYRKRGQVLPFSDKEIRLRYPRTLRYLRSYKKTLSKRNVSDPEPDKWFKYGRSQSLAKFDGRKKLVVKVLSLEPCFTYDESNLAFTGGGNGPYYGVSLKPGQRLSIFFLQGILNSKLTDCLVKSWSSVFRAGYYSFGKEFIEKLPMPELDLKKKSDRRLHDNIMKIVKRLIRLSRTYEKTMIPARKQSLESQITSLKDELNEAVYQLYCLTDDEKDCLRKLDIT